MCTYYCKLFNNEFKLGSSLPKYNKDSIRHADITENSKQIGEGSFKYNSMANRREHSGFIIKLGIKKAYLCTRYQKPIYKNIN